jgi:hypothetical protein
MRSRYCVSRNPQEVDDSTWYYESRSGIELYHEVRDSEGRFLKTYAIKIPRQMLEKSIERMNTKATKRQA